MSALENYNQKRKELEARLASLKAEPAEDEVAVGFLVLRLNNILLKSADLIDGVSDVAKDFAENIDQAGEVTLGLKSISKGL